jgi:HSP20 family protein
MTEFIKDTKDKSTALPQPFGNIFGNIVQEIENSMKSWSTATWMPSLFESDGFRLPLCEIVDKGDRYELHLEVPGMSKEHVKVRAQSHSVEITARKSKKTEEKHTGQIYTERSESSFFRRIPLPEQIVPQKIKSQVQNGILLVRLPKRSAGRAKAR